YGLFLLLQVARAERHDALDFVRFPFFPGAAVEPNLERLCRPVALPSSRRGEGGLAYFAHGVEDGVGTDAVRAVRIGEFAGDVDLRRLQALQEGDDVANIVGMDRGLGDGAGAVEAQVHEFELPGGNAARQGRRPRLRLADELLDVEDLGA